MMLDHQLEEQRIKLDRGRRLEPAHFFVGQHARHRLPAGRMMRVELGDRLLA